MAEKELFNQGLQDEIGDSDRIAFTTPGQEGAKNILWSKIKTLFLGVHNSLSGRSDSAAHPSSSITYREGTVQEEFDNADDGTLIESVSDDTEFMAQGNDLELHTGLKLWDYLKVKLNEGLNSLGFNTTNNPVWQQGLLFWDNTKKALSYYNENSNITVNLGQELLFRIYNDSGSTIPNGAVVSPNGATVALADARYKDRSRLMAVATSSIPNGEYGYVTRIGQVGGLDTSSYSAGDILYLGTDGSLTTTKQTDGGFNNIVGVVDVVDAADGIITVDTNVSELTVEVNDVNGFPEDQVSNMSVTLDEPTRTITVDTSASMFHYYILGDKYERDSPDTVVFPDTEGFKIVFYEGNTLTVIDNPAPSDFKNIVLKKAIVAYLYWNATDKKVEIDILNELHGISMSPWSHYYNHITRGAQIISGLGLSNFTIGNGNLDIHSQFRSESGLFFDEDIVNESAAIPVGGTIPVVWNDGPTRNIRTSINAGFAIDGVVGTSLYYNEFTGTTWQRTPVPNNDYCLYHILAINGFTIGTVSVMGQDVYGNLTDARIGATEEANRLVSDLPFPEMVLVGTIIYQYSNTNTSTYKANIVQTLDGEDYIDWRYTDLNVGTAPSSHPNLSNRDALDSHPIEAITGLSTSLTNLQAGIDSKMDELSSDGIGVQAVAGNGDGVELTEVYFVGTNAELVSALALASGKATIVLKGAFTVDIIGIAISATEINIIGGSALTLDNLSLLPLTNTFMSFDVELYLTSTVSKAIQNQDDTFSLNIHIKYINGQSGQELILSNPNGGALDVRYTDKRSDATITELNTSTSGQLNKFYPASNYLKIDGSNINSTPKTYSTSDKFLIEDASGFRTVQVNDFSDVLTWVDNSNLNLIVKGSMLKLGGAFTIEIIVDFKVNPTPESVSLFPSELDGCFVRFETAENILISAPPISVNFSGVTFNIDRFYDNSNGYISGSSSWGQDVGEGFIMSNTQDDTGTYKQNLTALALCEDATLEMTWHTSVANDCVASITITGSIKGYGNV